MAYSNEGHSKRSNWQNLFFGIKEDWEGIKSGNRKGDPEPKKEDKKDEKEKDKDKK